MFVFNPYKETTLYIYILSSFNLFHFFLNLKTSKQDYKIN